MGTEQETSNWEAGKDYPEWMNEVSLATISKGYLLPGETPRKAYKRVADTIADRLDRPDLASKFFRYMSFYNLFMRFQKLVIELRMVI